MFLKIYLFILLFIFSFLFKTNMDQKQSSKYRRRPYSRTRE